MVPVARSTLVDTIAAAIVDRIVSGKLEPGDPLPSQDALAADLGVSRLTVREAVKALAQSGIVRVEHGSGTFVNPGHRWTDLGALSRLAADAEGAIDVPMALIEVRRMIEVGAAELCARRHTPDVIVALDAALAGMAAATDASDLPAYVRHDIAFHDAILRGSGNPFIAAVFVPMRAELERARTQTSSVDAIRRHALAHHRAIRDAIAARDAAGARAAMDAHMDQTADDLAVHLA